METNHEAHGAKGKLIDVLQQHGRVGTLFENPRGSDISGGTSKGTGCARHLNRYKRERIQNTCTHNACKFNARMGRGRSLLFSPANYS